MVCLKKDNRLSLIDKFRTLLHYFPVGQIALDIHQELNDPSKPRSYLSHLFFINNLHKYDFSSITDIELIMLCGKFGYEFPAGNSYFNHEQTLAINRLNDEILRMKHSEENDETQGTS